MIWTAYRDRTCKPLQSRTFPGAKSFFFVVVVVLWSYLLPLPLSSKCCFFIVDFRLVVRDFTHHHNPLPLAPPSHTHTHTLPKRRTSSRPLCVHAHAMRAFLSVHCGHVECPIYCCFSTTTNSICAMGGGWAWPIDVCVCVCRAGVSCWKVVVSTCNASVFMWRHRKKKCCMLFFFFLLGSG